MIFNQNIGLIIYQHPVYLWILPILLSFSAKTRTSTTTHRSSTFTHINPSCPIENPKLSKGLGDVQKWRNLHAKRCGDISSGWHYHQQRSDIRDNFFWATEKINCTHSPWHTRKQQLVCGVEMKASQLSLVAEGPGPGLWKAEWECAKACLMIS